MHILFLCQYFPPEMGAPSARTYDNAKRWAAAGHRVTVITGVPNHPMGKIYPGYKNRVIQFDERDGIRIVRPWMYIAANRGKVRRSLNFLSYMLASILASPWARDVDVVVATSPQILCACAGYAVSRLKRRPFVMEVRDMWPESIKAVGAMKGGLLYKAMEWMESFLYRQARQIVVVTHAFKQAIVDKGISADKISIVTNGVDLEFFRPLGTYGMLKEHLGLEGKFVASYIGTHGMAHGLDTLLEAARLLHGYQEIVILMIGEGARKEALAKKKEEQDLDNVVMLPFQPKERMPAFIAASDVCLVLLRDHPLFRTVIPSKIFEYMAMARPIIQGVLGESAEIVAGAGCGKIVEPENPQQLASAILGLYQDPELRMTMGTKGREFVVKNYNRDLLAGSFLEILLSLNGRAAATLRSVPEDEMEMNEKRRHAPQPLRV